MEDPLSLVTGAKKRNEMPNFEKHNIKSCIINFNRYVLGKNPEKTKKSCIKYAMEGELESNYIRPTAWKIFLNTLPSSPEDSLKTWVTKVKEQRKKFKKKVKDLTSIKKFKNDPLGGANKNDDSWGTFFEDTEIKRLIDLDVQRTYADRDLFQNETIKDILKNILFIWTKENRNPSYRQGMNEILAILLYALYPFYTKDPNAKEHEKNDELINKFISEPIAHQNEIYYFFHNENELQTDLYYLFTAIMKQGMTKFYEDIKFPATTQRKKDEKDEMKTYLNNKGDEIIYKLLKIFDLELYNHFIKIDLDCTIFLQRWLKCLFNREFHPRDVEVLWDVILAKDKEENKTGLGLADYICVAMIDFIKGDLLEKDQNESFTRLFKYPPIESTYTIVELALQVKEKVERRLGINEERKKPIISKPSITPQSSHSGKDVVFKDAANIQFNVTRKDEGKVKEDNNKKLFNSPLPRSEYRNAITVNSSAFNSNSNVYTFGGNNNMLYNNLNFNSGSGSGNSNSGVKESSINSSSNKGKVTSIEKNVTQIKGLLKEMKDIFNKYRMQMELKDIGKMESLFEEIKKNMQ